MNKIIYRAAGSKDLQGFTECLESVYGREYFHREFYNPEYLEKKLGNLYIAVDGGNVAATIAGLSSGYMGRDYELGVLTVRPEYSGGGIAGRLISYVLSLNARLMSVKGRVVTIHARSQHIVEKGGFVPTGILFNTLNMSEFPKQGESDRQSLLMYTRNFSALHNSIYVPSVLREAAADVYSALGVLTDMKSDRARIPQNSEIWNCTEYADEHFRALTIYIQEYGEDCFSRLQRIIGEEMSLYKVSVHIFLNMRSETIIAAYEELTAIGYIFSGFDPLAGESGYIILYGGDISAVRLDEIETTPSAAKMLGAMGIYKKCSSLIMETGGII